MATEDRGLRLKVSLWGFASTVLHEMHKVVLCCHITADCGSRGVKRSCCVYKCNSQIQTSHFSLHLPINIQGNYGTHSDLISCANFVSDMGVLDPPFQLHFQQILKVRISTLLI